MNFALTIKIIRLITGNIGYEFKVFMYAYLYTDIMIFIILVIIIINY